jgi:hypothetical protein
MSKTAARIIFADHRRFCRAFVRSKIPPRLHISARFTTSHCYSVPPRRTSFNLNGDPNGYPPSESRRRQSHARHRPAQSQPSRSDSSGFSGHFFLMKKKATSRHEAWGPGDSSSVATPSQLSRARNVTRRGDGPDPNTGQSRP